MDEEHDYPKPDDCEHRWDFLAIVGGWGEANVAYVDCKNCKALLYLPIEELKPRRVGALGRSVPELNERAQESIKAKAGKR